jgi:succinoglycan biosynthesis transport protein ExoP
MNHSGYPFPNRPMLAEVEADEPREFIDLERLWSMLKRQGKILAACAVVGVMLGFIYLQTTPPTYISYANVLIDENLSKLADQVTTPTASNQNDAAILSQIEIVRSARLAATVANKLRLDENPSFMNPPVSLAAKIVGYARQTLRLFLPSREPSADPAAGAAQPAAAVSREELMRKYAAMMLQSGIIAQRNGRSYVISIAYPSHDPNLAAEITKAYSDAFVADQLDASFEATEKAAVWLQGRLEELRTSSQKAALEVERFRSANGLNAARGTLISEQQLAELNAQLAIAQADTARAQARYEQYKAILDGGSTDAALNGALPTDQASTTNLNTVKDSLISVTKREREVTANFGADHPQAIALRKEQETLSNQINDELTRLVDGFRKEFEVARTRETALRASMSDVRGETADANEAMVRLRELEQQATALSTLYQTFLAKYEETAQQRSFPISRVRIISEAITPMQPSSPRTTLVLGLSLALGLMIGGGIGFLNEFNERFFRTGDDVRAHTGLKFLGYLPLIGDKDPVQRSSANGNGNGKPEPAGEKPMSASKARMRIAIDAPASMYAETLRNTKIASDIVLQGNGCKVIGIVSMLPAEGKSTVAANLATMLATYGSKTLLIDADLRNPGLTRGLGIGADSGLMEAVVSDQGWASVAKISRNTKLTIIPTVVRSRFSHTSELLASRGMRRLIEEARESFEHIIVDLPPLGPIVDAKAFAPLADGFVLVVEWGVTPRAIVNTMLASEPHIAGKVLGVVLSKVNMKQLARYGAAGGSEKFLDRYSKYYLDKTGRGSIV